MAKASERLQQQIDALHRLHATGPISTDYARWVDATLLLLATLFGETSSALRQFTAAVGERGRNDAFGLPVGGEWGIWARMERGETVLQRLRRRAEQDGD